MAIALGGRPDDSAKMVWSRGCMAYLSGWRGKGKQPVLAGYDLFLLRSSPQQYLYCNAAYNAAFAAKSHRSDPIP
ncbi:hypothetical protein [Bradyrhizobium rifense]|uniref:hypothetical protein n=1 Tax=Bradyrhizobium rifense TaxID=515499 RepID=UPI001652DF1F|nr:hypothetical protein [Bradyrhizobium rifense]